MSETTRQSVPAEGNKPKEETTLKDIMLEIHGLRVDMKMRVVMAVTIAVVAAVAMPRIMEIFGVSDEEAGYICKALDEGYSLDNIRVLAEHKKELNNVDSIEALRGQCDARTDIDPELECIVQAIYATLWDGVNVHRPLVVDMREWEDKPGCDVGK